LFVDCFGLFHMVLTISARNLVVLEGSERVVGSKKQQVFTTANFL